jgi:hypothetical protein
MGTAVLARITAPPWAVELDQLVLLDYVVANGDIAEPGLITVVLDSMPSLVRRNSDSWSVLGARSAARSLIMCNVIVFLLRGLNWGREERITSKVDLEMTMILWT